MLKIFDEKVETDVFGEAIEFDEKIQDIKFENVNYKYDDSNEYVLKKYKFRCKSWRNSCFCWKEWKWKNYTCKFISKIF